MHSSDILILQHALSKDVVCRRGWRLRWQTLRNFLYALQTYGSHFRTPDGRVYIGGFARPPVGAPHLLGTTEEIESLRPRTPPPGGGGGQ